jgi:hypothetical protein
MLATVLDKNLRAIRLAIRHLFLCRAFSEPTLIAFEQATKARKTPKFLSTYV